MRAYGILLYEDIRARGAVMTRKLSPPAWAAPTTAATEDSSKFLRPEMTCGVRQRGERGSGLDQGVLRLVVTVTTEFSRDTIQHFGSCKTW